MINILRAGALSGVLFGISALLINHITGIFQFEQTLPAQAITFILAGTVFALVSAGFVFVLQDRLPSKHMPVKAVLVTAALWLVLRIGASLLSHFDPLRYTLVSRESQQGFLLSILLGVYLGVFWKKEQKQESS